MYPQFKELVRKYSPSLIFSDGDWWMSDDLWETRPLPWKICRGNLHVDLSDVRPSELPCRHIFVLKIDGCQTGQD